jgi:O-acetylserine/cysteine efflux transporter
MPPRHMLLATTVAIAWGVNFVVIDVGLESFPPLLFVAFRFTLIAVPGLLIVGRPDVRARDVLFVGTFLSAGQFGLLFVGIDQGMPAGLASLVLQLQVVFTIGLAFLILKERLTARQVGGAAVAVVGIAVIAGGRTAGVPLGALALTVAAAGSWGIGNVLTRRAQAKNAAALLVWSSLVPPVPLLLLSLAFEGSDAIGRAFSHLSAGGGLAVLYVVVVSTAFGFGAWTWLLRTYAAARVVPFALIVPVAGLVSAWLALGETPNAAEICGSAIVMGGLAITMRAPHAPQAVQAPPASAPEAAG